MSQDLLSAAVVIGVLRVKNRFYPDATSIVITMGESFKDYS